MGSAEVSTAMEKALCSPDEHVRTASRESRSDAREGCRSWVRTLMCVTRSCFEAKHLHEVCAGGRRPWMRARHGDTDQELWHNSLTGNCLGRVAGTKLGMSQQLSLQGWRATTWATGGDKGTPGCCHPCHLVQGRMPCPVLECRVRGM